MGTKSLFLSGSFNSGKHARQPHTLPLLPRDSRGWPWPQRLEAVSANDSGNLASTGSRARAQSGSGSSGEGPQEHRTLRTDPLLPGKSQREKVIALSPHKACEVQGLLVW